MLLVYKVVLVEGLIGNSQLFHDQIPLLTCGASDQNDERHSEVHEIIVLIDVSLVNDTREHIHTNYCEYEEHQKHQRPDISY